jgi:hypothetical protein
LKDVEDEVMKGEVDWKVFQCVDESGILVAEVVARVKWCKKKEWSYGKYQLVDFIFL